MLSWLRNCQPAGLGVYFARYPPSHLWRVVAPLIGSKQLICLQGRKSSLRHWLTRRLRAYDVVGTSRVGIDAPEYNNKLLLTFPWSRELYKLGTPGQSFCYPFLSRTAHAAKGGATGGGINPPTPCDGGDNFQPVWRRFEPKVSI